MKVKFFALLRDITGVKETTDFTGTTLVELLPFLIKACFYCNYMLTVTFLIKGLPGIEQQVDHNLF